MVKLVDMPDLGSGAARRVGSSPIIRTEKASLKWEAFLFCTNYKKIKMQGELISLTLRAIIRTEINLKDFNFRQISG
jgi:hypothetical protein